MSKHRIQIDDSLYNDISEYCKINNETISGFCQRVLKEQLLMEKFGDTPFVISTTPDDMKPIEPIFTSSKEKVLEEYIASPHKEEKLSVNIDQNKNETDENFLKIENIVNQEIKSKRRRL